MVWFMSWLNHRFNFFKNEDGRNVTVNGPRYRAMIVEYLLPEIEARNVGDISPRQRY